ncbi:hypothetical protein [Rhizobium etli]|uniref:hypothetical protein n=1 Tax=Rhizobium etli TaxID=29449 RepID=UPI00163FB5CE|nr:hypothetical protein [Rhizobium sp. IE4771]
MKTGNMPANANSCGATSIWTSRAMTVRKAHISELVANYRKALINLQHPVAFMKTERGWFDRHAAALLAGQPRQRLEIDRLCAAIPAK